MHEVHKVLVGARPRQGDTDDPENWARYDLIWPHLEPSEVWNCDDEEPASCSSTGCGTCGSAATTRRRSRSARKLEEQWQEKIGPDDEQTLSLRFHIANVLRSQGKFEAAYELDTEIFAKQQESLGDGHPLHPADRGQPRRRPARARPVPRGAGARRGDLQQLTRTLLGPDDPTTLSSAEQPRDGPAPGRATASGPGTWTAETLNYRQAVLGPDHPYTLHSAVDARPATCGRRATTPDRSSCSRRPISAIRRARRGLRGHPADRQEPGGLARKVGRLDEAYALTKETDDRYQRIYEPSHPDALACKLNLACDLSARDEKTRRLRGGEPGRCEAYQATLGADAPVHAGGARTTSPPTCAGSARCATALELADQHADRDAGIARRGPPVHPVLRRSTRRTACTTSGG